MQRPQKPQLIEEHQQFAGDAREGTVPPTFGLHRLDQFHAIHRSFASGAQKDALQPWKLSRGMHVWPRPRAKKDLA